MGVTTYSHSQPPGTSCGSGGLSRSVLAAESKHIKTITLQGINISHLGKRKIIFKMPFLGDILVPWRVCIYIYGQTMGKVSWFYQTEYEVPWNPWKKLHQVTHRVCASVQPLAVRWTSLPVYHGQQWIGLVWKNMDETKRSNAYKVDFVK